MSHSIILADTQVIFRTGAARFIAMEADFRLAAQCGDLEQLQQAIASQPYAIAIFPVSIAPDLASLLDSVDRARSKAVLLVEPGTLLDGSIARRPACLLSRTVAGPQLVDCLRRVAAGKRCLPLHPESDPSLDTLGERVLERLTTRELQVVALVSQANRNREIAAQLGTTEQVVKNHLRSIYIKAGVSDRLELTVFTHRHRALAEAVLQAREDLAEYA